MNMPVFLVTIDHPDEELWRRHLVGHLAWIAEALEEGTLLASGPSVGTPVRRGLLVMTAPDEQALIDILARDPYEQFGVVVDRQIVGWDPLFGQLNEHSSQRGRTAAAVTALVTGQQ